MAVRVMAVTAWLSGLVSGTAKSSHLCSVSAEPGTYILGTIREPRTGATSGHG